MPRGQTPDDGSRQQLTELSGPFRVIAEYTYDWESWIDERGKLRWVNPAVERITGYSVAECHELQAYPLPLVHDADRPALAELLSQAQRGKDGNHYEFRVLRKDGQLRWAAISFQPVQDEAGRPIGYRSSVRDIHQRKKMEARLRAAVHRAEEANQAKARFLATVSHELRTPLQAVLGYAELLTNAELAPTLGTYANAVLEQGRHLEHLVNDLLDFASLKAGALPLRSEYFRPAEVLSQAESALIPQARTKGLQLESQLELPEQLLGDPVRILQVATNLLGNAVKFTPQGRVQLSASFDVKTAALVLRVDDTGPGLPDNLQVFEPFVRAASSASTDGGGVGLGLAISQQLCEALGGALIAERSPLGGARLTARFPSTQPETSESPGGVDAAPGANIEHVDAQLPTAPPRRDFAGRWPARVLVIDDVAPAREFLRDALSFLGYAPSIAAGADAGFSQAEQIRPNVVLVDIQMPELDGWSAARGLRSRLGSSPYLVALTADSQADDAKRLTEVGFNAFAQKPLSMRELQALLMAAHRRNADATQNQRASAEGPPPSVQPDSRAAVACPELFDPERWRELSLVEIRPGLTLLERMQRRVVDTLPEVLARLERSGSDPKSQDLRQCVHELHGLFALIGAKSAANLADQLEIQLEREDNAEISLLRLQAQARQVLLSLDQSLQYKPAPE